MSFLKTFQKIIKGALTGHEKIPKGPPFAYVFWKNFKKIMKGALTGHEKFSKGPPFAYVFWKNRYRNSLINSV